MAHAISMDSKPWSYLDRGNPSSLLRLFGVLSALSVAVILFLAGYGVYRIYSNSVIEDAERGAAAVGGAIFEQERTVLLKREPGGSQRISITREDFAVLDERMRRFLRPFRIYKIKIYSGDKTIVYSTDRSIIGQVDSGNVKLDRVLQLGEIHSKLESKDAVLDLAGEERFNLDVVEAYVPIRVGDRVVGSFEVYVDVTPQREQIARVLASSLAVLAAVLVAVFASLFVPMRQGTLRLKHAQDELRAMAATDTLTGIFNRRYLLARAEEEYSRMQRDRRRRSVKASLSLIMIDIDHFKRINDTYGHLAGDEILRGVSARLRRGLRVYDVFGRYGGEEFLAVLPNADFNEAREIAARMHQAARATPFSAGGVAVDVTVSCGVACSAEDGEDLDDVLRRADQGLYQAKNTGRDRVGWV